MDFCIFPLLSFLQNIVETLKRMYVLSILLYIQRSTRAEPKKSTQKRKKIEPMLKLIPMLIVRGAHDGSYDNFKIFRVNSNKDSLNGNWLKSKQQLEIVRCALLAICEQEWVIQRMFRLCKAQDVDVFNWQSIYRFVRSLHSSQPHFPSILFLPVHFPNNEKILFTVFQSNI